LGSTKSDSIGVFQQRNREPWNKRDRTNPYEAALSFFEQLKQVRSRDNMEMWQAAAKVQRPAKEYEKHYEQWKQLAQQVVSAKMEKPNILGLQLPFFQGGVQQWDQKTFLAPVDAPVTSGFGMRIHPIKGTLKPHNGIDYGVPTGTPVRASIPGKILVATDENDGFGNKIIIENGEYKTVYAHLQSVNVAKENTAKAGDTIGTVGSTGLSTAPHLHFEIHYQGQPIDPQSKFSER
jgi:murein DD-endopeptidase MepM/ murein hydrolase activator NlpD